MKTSWILGLTLLAGCGSINNEGLTGDAGSPPNDAQRGDGMTSDRAATEDGSREDTSTSDTGGGSVPTDDAAIMDAGRSEAGRDTSSTDNGSVGDAPRADAVIGDASVDSTTTIPDAPVADTRQDIRTADVNAPDVPGTGGSGGSGGTGGGGTAGTGGTGGTGGSGGTAGTGGTGATGGTGGSGGGVMDAAIDTACQHEADQQFCTRLGKSCETVSGTDNCGTTRSVNCGTCTGGQGCVDQVCKTPVCTSLSYSDAIYAPFSQGSVQEYIVAGSADGQSVIYVQSTAGTCNPSPIFLADETSLGSGTYTSRDITAWWTSNSVGWAGLSGDGLTIVTYSSDTKTMSEAHRGALQNIFVSAVDSTNYGAVNGFLSGTSGIFNGIALSTNGLQLYYAINGISTAADGIYRSTRTAVNTPFSVGQRISTIDSTYTFVSGISTDGLTLFFGQGYSGTFFTRTSTSAEFSNPNGAGAPPVLQGWQHKPIRNCRLLSTYSAGGCLNQDIWLSTPQ